MNAVVAKLSRIAVGLMAACLAASVGCDSSKADETKRRQMQAQQIERYQQQLAQSEERSRRADALDSRYEALLTKWEEQTRRADQMDDRYEALLVRWEDQARRVDALLERIRSSPQSRPGE